MDPVEPELENCNGSDQSDGEKPEQNMDGQTKSGHVNELGNRLKPVKGQYVNDKNGKTQKEYR